MVAKFKDRLPEVAALFRPKPRIRSIEWFVWQVRTHENRPYDHRAFPHIGAPGGPCCAVDDPAVKDIVLQWATRLGKTFFGQACTMFYADVTPGPQMFAGPDEKLAKEVASRTARMLSHCPRLAEQLPPPHRRKDDRIDLAHCRMHVAWSRSVSTLADKPVQFGHAGEVDKWVQESTSLEADPLKLFDDRFKEFSRFKRLKESTPTVRNRSRIETARKRSSNCQYYTPCPHCGHYQTLRMGNRGEPGRLEWDAAEDGRQDTELARATARYVCEGCEGQIHDRHRARMLRHGVWVPEGCGVDSKQAAKAAKRWQERLSAADWYGDLLSEAGDDGASLWRGWQHAGWVTGTPVRDGRAAGYQLSSLYATSLSWGDIAAEFVASKDSPQLLRNFKNQWLGETWEATRRRHTWEDLGKRLSADYDRGVVPSAVWFLTAGVDVQEDRAYWTVRAWGERKTSWLIDWGIARKTVNSHGQFGPNSDLKQLVSALIERSWPVDGQTSEGFDKLWAAIVGIDTGHRIHEVHQFMREVNNPRLRAVAGDAAVRGGFYRRSLLERNSHTGKAYEGGLTQWQLNVDAFKEDIRALWDVAPGQDGAWYLPRQVLTEGVDYLRQVCNEAPEEETTARGFTRRRWKMLEDAVGNHYWDTEVYARAVAEMITEGDWLPHVAPTAAPTEQQPATRGRRSMSRRSQSRR